MARRRRRRAGLLCAAALTCSVALCGMPQALLAQPDTGGDGSADTTDTAAAQPREQARALANAGFELFQRGQYDDALVKLQQAEQLYHAPTLVLMTARVQDKLGRLLAAEASYRRVLAEKLAPDAPAEFAQAHEQARTELAALEQRMPRLVVQLSDPTAAGRIELTIDGQPAAAGWDRAPVPLDPGRHTIALSSAGGTPKVWTLVFAESQPQQIRYQVPAAPGAAGGPAVAGAPGEQQGQQGQQGGSLLPAAVAFGAGGVGLVVGVVAGVIALGKQADLEASCPSKVCYPEDQDLADAATSSATISTVGFVIAGLGTAAGVTLLLLRSPSSAPEPAALRLRLSPLAAGLSATF